MARTWPGRWRPPRREAAMRRRHAPNDHVHHPGGVITRRPRLVKTRAASWWPGARPRAPWTWSSVSRWPAGRGLGCPEPPSAPPSGDGRRGSGHEGGLGGMRVSQGCRPPRSWLPGTAFCARPVGTGGGLGPRRPQGRARVPGQTTKVDAYPRVAGRELREGCVEGWPSPRMAAGAGGDGRVASCVSASPSSRPGSRPGRRIPWSGTADSPDWRRS